MTRPDEEEVLTRAAGDRLVVAGVADDLRRDEAEVLDWLAWDLASRIEGHFHQVLDVRALSPSERERWRERCSPGGAHRGDPFLYRQPCWLLEDRARVGTIALGTLLLGDRLVSISSLYVEPGRRRRGIAGRALAAARDAAVAGGASGIRLETHWTWQPAVRFYARLGLWVRGWKHALGLVWSDALPRYRVDLSARSACFQIERGGSWRSLIEAEHRGDRLGWEVRPEAEPVGRFDEAAFLAPGTMALHLALAGWPLIRSAASWARRWSWSDMGEPEGLAGKIEVFEAVDRRDGFPVRTPRLPGIAYRDLEAIDAELG